MRLAESEEEFCGKDVKNAVIDAALQTARSGRDTITQRELLSAVKRIVDARMAIKDKKETSRTVKEEEKSALAEKLKFAFQEHPEVAYT